MNATGKRMLRKLKLETLDCRTGRTDGIVNTAAPPQKNSNQTELKPSFSQTKVDDNDWLDVCQAITF